MSASSGGSEVPVELYLGFLGNLQKAFRLRAFKSASQDHFKKDQKTDWPKPTLKSPAEQTPSGSKTAKGALNFLLFCMQAGIWNPHLAISQVPPLIKGNKLIIHWRHTAYNRRVATYVFIKAYATSEKGQ